jgi:hypothetical protein
MSTPVPIVRIRISHDQPAPQPDALLRSRIGYPTQPDSLHADRPTLADLWERSRGVWKLSATRVVDAKLVVIVYNDIVRLVAEPTGVTIHGDRVALTGVPTFDHPLVGQLDPVPSASRNPVGYGWLDDGQYPKGPWAPRPTPPTATLRDFGEAIDALTRLAVVSEADFRGIPRRSEFATTAANVLAHVAANLGGVDELLGGTHSTVFTTAIRQLIDEVPGTENLLSFRTAPVTLPFSADVAMAAAGLEQLRDEATSTLIERAELDLDESAEDQRLRELAVRAESLFTEDGDKYREAFKTTAQTVLAERGIDAPVEVYPWPTHDLPAWDGFSRALHAEVLERTPLPMTGRPRAVDAQATIDEVRAAGLTYLERVAGPGF